MYEFSKKILKLRTSFNAYVLTRILQKAICDCNKLFSPGLLYLPVLLFDFGARTAMPANYTTPVLLR